MNDLFGTNVQPGDGQTKSTLQKLRDYFLAALAFPLGTVSTFTEITPGRKKACVVNINYIYPSLEVTFEGSSIHDIFKSGVYLIQ